LTHPTNLDNPIVSKFGMPAWQPAGKYDHSSSDDPEDRVLTSLERWICDDYRELMARVRQYGYDAVILVARRAYLLLRATAPDLISESVYSDRAVDFDPSWLHGLRVAVVDDSCESGRSIRAVLDRLDHAEVASVDVFSLVVNDDVAPDAPATRALAWRIEPQRLSESQYRSYITASQHVIESASCSYMVDFPEVDVRAATVGDWWRSVGRVDVTDPSGDDRQTVMDVQPLLRIQHRDVVDLAQLRVWVNGGSAVRALFKVVPKPVPNDELARFHRACWTIANGDDPSGPVPADPPAAQFRLLQFLASAYWARSFADAAEADVIAKGWADVDRHELTAHFGPLWAPVLIAACRRPEEFRRALCKVLPPGDAATCLLTLDAAGEPLDENGVTRRAVERVGDPVLITRFFELFDHDRPTDWFTFDDLCGRVGRWVGGSERDDVVRSVTGLLLALANERSIAVPMMVEVEQGDRTAVQRVYRPGEGSFITQETLEIVVEYLRRVMELPADEPDGVADRLQLAEHEVESVCQALFSGWAEAAGAFPTRRDFEVDYVGRVLSERLGSRTASTVDDLEEGVTLPAAVSRSLCSWLVDHKVLARATFSAGGREVHGFELGERRHNEHAVAALGAHLDSATLFADGLAKAIRNVPDLPISGDLGSVHPDDWRGASRAEFFMMCSILCVTNPADWANGVVAVVDDAVARSNAFLSGDGTDDDASAGRREHQFAKQVLTALMSVTDPIERMQLLDRWAVMAGDPGWSKRWLAQRQGRHPVQSPSADDQTALALSAAGILEHANVWDNGNVGADWVAEWRRGLGHLYRDLRRTHRRVTRPAWSDRFGPTSPVVLVDREVHWRGAPAEVAQ